MTERHHRYDAHEARERMVEANRLAASRPLTVTAAQRTDAPIGTATEDDGERHDAPDGCDDFGSAARQDMLARNRDAAKQPLGR